MDNSQPVRRDMSDDWNEKLSKILSEIDEAKQTLSVLNHSTELYVQLCYFLKERTISWYGKLFPKLIEDEKETYNNLMNEILNLPLTKNIYPQGPSFNWSLKPTVYIINTEKYRDVLNKLEIHLNSCMERIGLTNQPKNRGVM